MNNVTQSFVIFWKKYFGSTSCYSHEKDRWLRNVACDAWNAKAKTGTQFEDYWKSYWNDSVYPDLIEHDDHIDFKEVALDAWNASISMM